MADPRDGSYICSACRKNLNETDKTCWGCGNKPVKNPEWKEPAALGKIAPGQCSGYIYFNQDGTPVNIKGEPLVFCPSCNELTSPLQTHVCPPKYSISTESWPDVADSLRADEKPGVLLTPRHIQYDAPKMAEMVEAVRRAIDKAFENDRLFSARVKELMKGRW